MTLEPETTDSLLASVIRITELRDRDALGSSLVETVRELTRVHQATLYKCLPTPGGKRVLWPVSWSEQEAARNTICPASLDPDLSQDYATCLESVAEWRVTRDGHYLRTVIDGTDQVCGVLDLRADELSPLERQLIEDFPRIYRNYLTVLDDSERDTLTGPLNRKTFDRNIARILSYPSGMTEASSSPSDRRHPGHGDDTHWLAVMDVDYFKRVNDNFGHVYGDEVLLLLARLMFDSFRQKDRLYRFGGEEFVILLEPTDAQSALAVLNRFREKVASYEFPQVGQVTVSIGFAGIRASDVPTAILGEADQAMYYAKQHGRNQVCFYGDLVAQGEIREVRGGGEAEFF